MAAGVDRRVQEPEGKALFQHVRLVPSFTYWPGLRRGSRDGSEGAKRIKQWSLGNKDMSVRSTRPSRSHRIQSRHGTSCGFDTAFTFRRPGRRNQAENPAVGKRGRCRAVRAEGYEVST